eukprot:TRINITY_DN24113_c0_g1_i1.p1 TRINITY_DN24113_c0_g1~~TRINITY_DN24113_c0_g1_i1.p1  ORF type:complete len:183 (+),score=6.67 TRINITY_DN24113_c0_g1_i1:134-682(+)
MVRYSRRPRNEEKGALTRGSYLKVHFKNTRETAKTIKNMQLDKAMNYLEDVKAHRRCVPFRRFCRGVGRTGQAKEWGRPQGRWPEKSCRFLLQLLQNVKSNAEYKKLNTDECYIKHIQVNQAPKTRRRTYRAHGRINPYMASPSHIELFVEERQVRVPKAGASKKAIKATRKKAVSRSEETN